MRYSTNLRDGLIGAWCPSISGSGGYLLPDVSGNGIHLTLTNMTPEQDLIVRDGYQAIDFDGTNDYAWSEVRPNIFPTPILSLSCWFWSTAFSTNAYFFSLGNSSDSGPILALRTSTSPADKASYLVRNNLSASAAGDSSTSINTSSWQHIVLTVNMQSTLTVNNTSTSPVATPSWPTTINRVALGALIRTTVSAYTACSIADARIYGRSLSPVEIRQLYIGGPGYGLRPERRRRYYVASGPAFKPYWVRKQSQIFGGGVS